MYFSLSSSLNKQLCLTSAKAVYGGVTVEEVGLKRQAQDMSEVTEYGKDFQVLASAHGFVIYNGLSQWSRSNAAGLAADHAYLLVEVKDRCTRDAYAKKDSGWLNTNLLGRQLMCIVMEYIMTC